MANPKPDYTELADDYIKALPEDQVREALYRQNESLRQILENIDARLTDGGL